MGGGGWSNPSNLSSCPILAGILFSVSVQRTTLRIYTLFRNKIIRDARNISGRIEHGTINYEGDGMLFVCPGVCVPGVQYNR